MARIYSDEEKQAHLDQYKVSGKCKTEYARENDIPEATFRAWIKEENYSDFGILEANSSESEKVTKIVKPIIFANENIRLELREGYDKELLRRIIEVITNDKQVIK